MTTVIISIPESLKQFLDAEVEIKGCGDAGEYIRSLLTEAQAKTADTRLETLLLEGLSGGEDIPLNVDFWPELKADAARINGKA